MRVGPPRRHTRQLRQALVRLVSLAGPACLSGPWAERALCRYTATPLAAPVLANEAVHADVKAHTPLGRVAQPEEVSGESSGCRLKCGAVCCFVR